MKITMPYFPQRIFLGISGKSRIEWHIFSRKYYHYPDSIKRALNKNTIRENALTTSEVLNVHVRSIDGISRAFKIRQR